MPYPFLERRVDRTGPRASGPSTAARPPPIPHVGRMNLVVTELPFGDGLARRPHGHLLGRGRARQGPPRGAGPEGHRRLRHRQGDPGGRQPRRRAMQPSWPARCRVEGDMAKLMALQSTPADDSAKELAIRLREITVGPAGPVRGRRVRMNRRTPPPAPPPPPPPTRRRWNEGQRRRPGPSVSPERRASDSWMVTSTWIPATSPTWAASSWAALDHPELAGVDRVGLDGRRRGRRHPHAQAGQAQGHEHHHGRRRAPSSANTTIDAATDPAPTVALTRSPTFARSVAGHRGADREHAAGRATETRPTWSRSSRRPAPS